MGRVVPGTVIDISASSRSAPRCNGAGGTASGRMPGAHDPA
ncbi:MAG: hypothetical protein ABI187_10460 [Ornithinibacter sp.]